MIYMINPFFRLGIIIGHPFDLVSILEIIFRNLAMTLTCDRSEAAIRQQVSGSYSLSDINTKE